MGIAAWIFSGQYDPVAITRVCPLGRVNTIVNDPSTSDAQISIKPVSDSIPDARWVLSNWSFSLATTSTRIPQCSIATAARVPSAVSKKAYEDSFFMGESPVSRSRLPPVINLGPCAVTFNARRYTFG